MNRLQAVIVLVALCCVLLGTAAHAELPVLHVRTANPAPALCSKLDNTSYATGWYPASPTWFGLGGKTGDKNHTEIRVTYDSTNLYIAYLNVDRSTRVVPQGTAPDLRTVDSNGIWIQTPSGRLFYIVCAVDDRYPAQPKRASGDSTSFDGKTDRLVGLQSKGWFAGNLTLQGTCIIPWSALGTSAPAPGSRWRINFVNYNQYSGAVNASTVNRQMWAPGSETQPDQWGYITFDEAAPTPAPSISPEATLTLHPATNAGMEVTLKAGNAADQGNQWANEAVTQSNWNDWDPVDYTIKEFLQYDLSMIPPGRKIISARLRNYCRGNYNSGPSDLYVHVLRLDGSYDPKTITFLTSPLPVENSERKLILSTDGGKWFDFDITDLVTRAYESGQRYASFALSGSNGDTHNGKIWGTSFGRADYYDGQRPKVIITFGQPGVNYSSLLQLGSDQHTSVATSANKNKLTNGTFRYGSVEGIWNSMYWQDPGWAYINGKNVPYLVKAGDVNSSTGHTAIRFMTPISWKFIKQTTRAVTVGKTYTLSCWFKGSASGVKADMRLTFRDSAGNSLGTVQKAYGGSGSWERLYVSKTAPSGTVSADVYIYDDTAGAGQYVLLSDILLEEGSSPTAYSETMGVYYPDYPRSGGATSSTPSLSLTMTADKTSTAPGGTVTYTVTYTNIGTDAASSVVVSAPVPAYTTYVAGGTYDSASRTVTWTIPSVPIGGAGTLTYKVTVD